MAGWIPRRKVQERGRCETCWHAGPRMNYDDHECRRYAPDREKVESHQDIRMHVPRWPIMKAHNWCGEYMKRSEPQNGEAK